MGYLSRKALEKRIRFATFFPLFFTIRYIKYDQKRQEGGGGKEMTNEKTKTVTTTALLTSKMFRSQHLFCFSEHHDRSHLLFLFFSFFSENKQVLLFDAHRSL